MADWSKRGMTIINITSGEEIRSFGRFGSGHMEFDLTEGVALTRDGHIVVADSSNHRLQVLTEEGAFVAAVGSRGSQPLQFHYPHDVAVDHNGRLFVTELWNHRVQVLNPDMSFSHCFGNQGDKPGQLYGPRGIAIDQDGMVYISDFGNHRIQKFAASGVFLASFVHKKSFSPYGLCFDNNDLLYATDMQNSVVCVFNTSGKFLGYIGNSDGSSFDHPRFIVSDKDRLYITDDNGMVTNKCFQQALTLDVICSPAHIAKFSEHIEDWEELAPYFGLTEAEKQEIRASHALVQKRKMLWKWVRKLGEKATYREMIKVFEEAGESLLILRVKELLEDSYSEAPRIIVNSFRKYLKDCYSTSASDGVADREDWPRLLKHPMIFVNPELVSKDEKTSLTTLDIFKDKKVMLEGTSGSGKTRLMTHACQQWAEGKLLSHVDLLIHLTLAEPILWSAKCLEDIIPHPTSIMRRAVAEYITERGGKGCCFILDGWEDLPEELHTSSFIHDLLKGSRSGLALPQCSFIVTTRPIASPSLQPLVTTIVEITGFSSESVDTYASQYLTQQGKDPAVFITALNDNHHARGLCSLPINAAILLHLFLTIQTGLPTTQTELFNCFILNLLLRHLVAKAKYKRAKPLLRCFSDLPSNETKAFNNLCLISYHSTFSGKVASQSNQLISSDDLHKAGLQDVQETLGLMKVHQQLTWCGYDTRYGFLHSSVQDFLCAVKMSQLSPEQQVKDFICIMTSNPTSLVLRFYAGITKLESVRVCKYLCQIGMNPPGAFVFNNLCTASSDPRRLFLTYLHCLYEAKHNKILCQFDSKNLVCFLYYRLSIHDLNVIWYFMLDMIEKCHPEVLEFIFMRTEINDHGIESAVTTFINQANILNSSIGCFRLQLSDAGITYNGVRSLTKLMRTKNISLIEFTLQSKIDFITLNLLIGAVPTSTITSLGLMSVGSPLTSRHIYHLVLLIHQARQLKKLDLKDNSMLAEGVPLLLMAARNVEQLILRSILRNEHLQEIGPILQSNTSLIFLDIETELTYMHKRCFYSLDSLCKFIKVITAPESRSQLRILVTEYAEDIYANKELMTTVNKFVERRGYPLTFYSRKHQGKSKVLKSLNKLQSLPESLITGRT